MKTAILVGSFNPITKGHLDLIKRSLNIASKVVIGVYSPISKKGFNLPADLRLNLVKNAIKELPNVSAYLFEGLAIDFAKKHKGDFFLRGIRNQEDLSYEMDLAQTNHALDNIETFFVPTDPNLGFLRSTWVRDLMTHRPEKLPDFLPEGSSTLLADYLIKRPSS